MFLLDNRVVEAWRFDWTTKVSGSHGIVCMLLVCHEYVSGQWKSRDCLCRVLYVCVTSIGFHCMYVSSSVCLCHEYYLLVTRFFKIHGLYKHFNHKYWLPFSPSHNTTSFLSFSQLLFSTNKSWEHLRLEKKNNYTFLNQELITF